MTRKIDHGRFRVSVEACFRLDRKSAGVHALSGAIMNAASIERFT